MNEQDNEYKRKYRAKKIKQTNFFLKIHNYYKNKKPIHIVISVLLGIILIAVIASICSVSKKNTRNLEQYVVSDNVTVSVNDGKEYHGELKKILGKLELEKLDDIKIRFNLPERYEIKNPCLVSTEPNSKMKVYLDSEEIYSIGDDTIYGEIVGSQYMKIKIPENSQGKEVLMELTLYDRAALSAMYEIKFMNTYDADRDFIERQFISIMMALTLMLFGELCILFDLFTYTDARRDEIKKEIMASIMGIAGGMWMLSSQNAFVFINVGSKVEYYIEFESLYVTVLVGSLIVYDKIKNSPRKVFAKYCIYCNVIYILFANITRVMNMIYLQEILPIFHVIIVITVFVSTILYIIESAVERYVTVIAIALTAIVMNFIYNYNNNYDVGENGMNILCHAIFFLVIMTFAAIIAEVGKNYLNVTEKKLLVEMAFEDALTGVNNRRSCERKMKQVDTDIEDRFIVYSFDINGLKKVNDGLGHKEGDKLILCFAQALKQVFDDENSFVGRMGGDEFLAIEKLGNEGEKIIEPERIGNDMLSKLSEKVDEINRKNKEEDCKFEVSYSAGFYECDRSINMKAWRAYNMADKQMYKEKKEWHNIKDGLDDVVKLNDLENMLPK